MSKKPPKVDPAIMAELLDQPSVKQAVEKMTSDELEFYKDLLVSRGIYAKYVKERKKK